MELYGTEESCKAALELVRWSAGLRCPRCAWQLYEFIHGRKRKRYQCVTVAIKSMEATKLLLNTWFLAFYLIGQA